jgi:hypothetical protein
MTPESDHGKACDCSGCSSRSEDGVEGVRERLAMDPFGFFAPPPSLPEPVPPGHQARPGTTSSKPIYRYSRIRATTTTFGLWIKIPVTFVLLVLPVLTAARDIYFGYYKFTVNSAADLLFNAITLAVCVAITRSLWRRGRV